jgi:hypothetical protein
MEKRWPILISCKGYSRGFSSSSVVSKKLLACREGLELSVARSHMPIIVESDCTRVISVALERTLDRSPYLNIISDIKLLASLDRVCKFVKVDRSEVRASPLSRKICEDRAYYFCLAWFRT